MNYEQGLEQLKQRLHGTTMEQDFLVYEARLRENLHNERLYGTREQYLSERAQIIDQLNRLAQQVNVSFNDLCLTGKILPSTLSSATPNKHNSSQTAHNSARSLTVAPNATILTYDIHADFVRTVAWSPDGERIASASGDGIVHIWDANSRHNIITYRGHSSEILPRTFTTIWKALWSPDGQYIASSGYGTTVRIWESNTGKDILIYHDHQAIIPLLETYAIAWSPDGTRIASACSPKNMDQTVHIWNAATGSNLLKYSGHALHNIMVSFSVTALAWSPNGEYIASRGTDKNVKKWKLNPTTANTSIQIWAPATGKHILTCLGDSVGSNDITWSPDSKYIASADSNATVNIWDAATGTNIFTYKGHPKGVRAVAWSPDGSTIASAGEDHTVHLWHPFTGELLFIYREHTANVNALAWSPDGKRIASAGSDKTVRIWQTV
jgi:WD40 repeat protein